MSGSTTKAKVVKCSGTDDEHWNQTEECACPGAPDDTDEERNAKAKAYGIEFVETTDAHRAEMHQLLRRKRVIREQNAYYASLPVPTEEELEQEALDNERIIAEWDKALAEVQHERATRPLDIGEWPHGDYTPVQCKDNHMAGFTLRYGDSRC